MEGAKEEKDVTRASKKWKYKSETNNTSAQPGPSSGPRKRRRKTRKYKPYNKLSWQERRDLEDRETRRANRIRAQRFANGQPVAPYNTTQFLMEDHNDIKDIDEGLAPNAPHHQAGRVNKPRCRDSSFSLDSEDDFYYSSPEDEGEFLSKEFSNIYDDEHAEQLNALSKTKLIQEILNLEKKLELLQKNAKDKEESSSSSSVSDDNNKVLLFKSEITKLSEENNRLRAENECLRRRCYEQSVTATNVTSSIDSDSDSTASSSSSCCSSSSCDDIKCTSTKQQRRSETTNDDDDEQQVIDEATTNTVDDVSQPAANDDQQLMA